jgi:hypothetical protein
MLYHAPSCALLSIVYNGLSFQSGSGRSYLHQKSAVRSYSATESWGKPLGGNNASLVHVSMPGRCARTAVVNEK